MNTVKKIFSGAAVAAIIPMTVFANTSAPAGMEQPPRQQAAQNFETPEISNLAAPEEIPYAERDFDKYLADATLVDSPAKGKLVVSQDQQLIGSVSDVYEKPDGQLMAKVALDQTLDTNGRLALVPVKAIDESGNVQMDHDYDAIRNTFISEEGYDPQS